MITIKKGEDYTKYLHMEYAESGDPADLTGCLVFSQMRDVPGGTLLATAQCSTNAQNGDIWVTFGSDITSQLTPGNAGYDIWLVENGVKHPIYTATCKIIDAYTEDFGE